MKRIIIICEGPTEVEFCKDVLSPYFLSKGYILQTPKIKKSGGGIVSWSVLKAQIENHLKQDPEAYVTTLIDYYGILDKHYYPSWDKVKAEPDKATKMEILEDGMKSKLDPSLSTRFIPYVQLHEFEGLLFNNIEVFDKNIPLNEMKRDLLLKDISQNPNPELINDHKDTAPSKRLEDYISGYNKIVYGAILAEDIGLKRLREKSPRFNQWITHLESL